MGSLIASAKQTGDDLCCHHKGLSSGLPRNVPVRRPWIYHRLALYGQEPHCQASDRARWLWGEHGLLNGRQRGIGRKRSLCCERGGLSNIHIDMRWGILYKKPSQDAFCMLRVDVQADQHRYLSLRLCQAHINILQIMAFNILPVLALASSVMAACPLSVAIVDTVDHVASIAVTNTGSEAVTVFKGNTVLSDHNTQDVFVADTGKYLYSRS